jgi:hypothetical protein
MQHEKFLPSKPPVPSSSKKPAPDPEYERLRREVLALRKKEQVLDRALEPAAAQALRCKEPGDKPTSASVRVMVAGGKVTQMVIAGQVAADEKSCIEQAFQQARPPKLPGDPVLVVKHIVFTKR